MESRDHWTSQVSTAQAETRQRLSSLTAEGLTIFTDLLDRVMALPPPDSPLELAERTWQLQGFELMVSTAAYADKVASIATAYRERIHQAVANLCGQPFPKNGWEFRHLQRIQGLVYAELAGVQVDR